MADATTDALEKDEWIGQRAAHGFTVVNGGQIGPHEEGGALWQVTDLDDNVLAEGRGIESFNETFDTHKWCHTDRFETDLSGPKRFMQKHSEVPASLVQAL